MNNGQKLDRIKELIESFYNQTGHNKCHYYPDIFKEIAIIVGIKPEHINLDSLPELTEFKNGCEQFQNELYHK